MPLQRVWVEQSGKIIVARILGIPNRSLLKERHDRIMQLHQDTGCKKLLLDDLQMSASNYKQIEAQRALNPELNAAGFKIAILVPNSQMAYFARMKFNHENHRVIYNDMTEAILWLSQDE